MYIKKTIMHLDAIRLSVNQKGSIFFRFFLLFILSTGLFSQTSEIKPSTDETIRLWARHQEKKGEMFIASGEVELHFQNLTLLADQLEVDTSSYEVTAEGNVTLQWPSEIIVCERLIFNLKTREGKMEKVRAIARPNLLFGARTINKTSGEVYSLENAWLTTCTQPVPRWSFQFARANLKPEDYLILNRAVLRIKNLPVLYIPYIRYPLKERATGFLFPQLGFNQVKGFSLSESFYWPISRNTDLTLTGDYYSRQGIGTGLEYRYLLPSDTRGEIKAYVFFFQKNETGSAPKPAYLLRLNHQQNLPFGFRLSAQVDSSSSFNFLREFENNFSLATVDNCSYQLNLSKSWSYFNLSFRSSSFETFFPQTGQQVISAFLPQASFNLLKYRLFPFVYLSWESGVSNWRYSWKSPDQTETTSHQGNAYFRPDLSLPFSPASWLNISFSMGGIFTYYFQSYQPGTTTSTDNPLFTAQARLNSTLEGPIFYRIFFKEGEPFLKHLLIPFFSLNYDTWLKPSTYSRIISPLGLYRDDFLKFGLTQHLLIKDESSLREILTLGVSEILYFQPETSPVKFYYPLNPERHLSPLNAFLRYYPHGKFSLDVSADFNPYEKNFLNFRLSTNYGAPEDNFFFSFNWSKSYQVLALNSFFRSNQIGWQGSFRWPEKIEFKAQIEYDFQAKKLLYTGLAGIYHYQCLDFSFDLRVFYYRSRPETQFKFSIGLGNISRTSDLLGGFNF
ncbi:MAG: LPS-assembly protein LptD [Candidatus Saccharicenans sp.]